MVWRRSRLLVRIARMLSSANGLFSGIPHRSIECREFVVAGEARAGQFRGHTHFGLADIENILVGNSPYRRYVRKAYSAMRRGRFLSLVLCSSRPINRRFCATPSMSTRVCWTSGNSTFNQRSILALVIFSNIVFCGLCNKAFRTVSFSCKQLSP
jgi:hypothetical protein